MTEAEWLSSTRSRAMLGYLIDGPMRERYADRTYRLFACAAVRRLDPGVVDRFSLGAVQIAEQFARGQATMQQLERARRDVHACLAQRTMVGGPADDLRRTVASLAVAATEESGPAAAWEVVQVGQPVGALVAGDGLAGLIREVFGNPFHTPTLPEHWRVWNGGTILRLARHAREAGRFDEMPVLGDALEEAGCTDVQILEHCRSGLPHAPGCWVLELLLAEE